MNTNTTTTPTQVVAPAETATTISESKPNEGVTYNEGNGVVDTIVMTGPLSEIYTRALGVYFAKKPLDGSVLASESQAMDAVRNAAISDSLDAGLKEIADAVVLQTPAEVISNPDATVFAVDYSQVNRPEVIDAMDRLRTRAKASGMDYVFVVHVDPLTQSAPVYDGYNKMLPLNVGSVAKTDLPGGEFSRATENYCESLGFPMVYGMEGFANWLMDKYKNKRSYASEGIVDWYKSLFTENGSNSKNIVKSVVEGKFIGTGKDTPWHKEAIQQVDWLENTFRFLTEFEKRLQSLSDDDKGNDVWEEFGKRCPIQINRGQKITFINRRSGFDINEEVTAGKEFWNIKDKLSRDEAKDLAKKLDKLTDSFKTDILNKSLVADVTGPFSNTNLTDVRYTLNSYMAWLKNSVIDKDSDHEYH